MELKKMDREVLVLRFLEQMETEEIATILNLTPGTVRIRQLRALNHLRDLLAQKGNNP
jgi:RNA polymerase sigma factor (sigma-70 family)